MHALLAFLPLHAHIHTAFTSSDKATISFGSPLPMRIRQLRMAHTAPEQCHRSGTMGRSCARVARATPAACLLGVQYNTSSGECPIQLVNEAVGLTLRVKEHN